MVPVAHLTAICLMLILGSMVFLGLLPVEDEANFSVNTSVHNSAFSAFLADSNPKHFLSCAQARRSIKRGCLPFLAFVTEADIADATLAAASKTDSNVDTFASDSATGTEQADLLQHVDTLNMWMRMVLPSSLLRRRLESLLSTAP